MVDRDEKLTKGERIRGEKRIKAIFDDGERGFVYPFKYIYSRVEAPIARNAIVVVVPKKIHKKAVNRNLIRRRTKEAYRLNKSGLLLSEQRVDLVLICVSKEVEQYSKIEYGVRKIIKQISEGLK